MGPMWGSGISRVRPGAAGYGADTHMSEEEHTVDEEPNENDSPDHYVIFVDGAGDGNRQTHEDDIVDAVTIIERAGYAEDPEAYILEALRGQSGDVDEQFDPQGEVGPAQVDLTDLHRKHFQVTTRGEVFI